MTFAVFAKTHYPLRHSSKPCPSAFDISKDLKPGDIVYYISHNDTRIYGKFLEYGRKFCVTYGPDHLEIWAMWQNQGHGMEPGKGWARPSNVHLHTGEPPADLVSI